MKHLTLETKTATVSDLGEFEALAATWSVDRTNEQIIRGAFERTIKAWQESQKQIPLHWNHEGSAANVIGSVDPTSLAETDAGLYVSGRVDLNDSEVAKEAWRSMKNNAVSLSFGYLAKTREAKGGVTELVEIDLFEVSVVPAPANPDTRFLSLKATESPTSNPARVDFDGLRALTQAAGGPILTQNEARARANLPPLEQDKGVPLVESDPRNPLHEEAWKLIMEGANHGPLERKAEEPEPEQELSSEEDAKEAEQDDEDPEGKSTPDEDRNGKSTPHNPLQDEAWKLIMEGANHGSLPRRKSEPEPEPEPEPLDAATVQREAWASVLKG